MVEDEVDGPGVFIHVQDLPPVAAAVEAAVDAALLARVPQVSAGRHVDDVGVARMDLHLGDVTGGFQPQVLPALPAVIAAVDAVAPRGALPIVLLPGARVHDPRVGGREGHVAEGVDLHVLEDVHPGVPAVEAAPEAARGGGDPEHGGIVLERLHVVDPATRDRRAYGPGTEGFQLCFGDGGGLRGNRKRERERQQQAPQSTCADSPQMDGHADSPDTKRPGRTARDETGDAVSGTVDGPEKNRIRAGSVQADERQNPHSGDSPPGSGGSRPLKRSSASRTASSTSSGMSLAVSIQSR